MVVLKAILGIVGVALFFILLFMAYWVAGRLLRHIMAWPRRRSERRAEREKQAILDRKLKRLEVQIDALSAPAALCHVNPNNRSRKPLESRIGGWPAWPKGKPFPWGDSHEPFLHIAQINLAECPDLPDFPKTGIMQFFVGSDDYWGLEVGESRGGFHIVYHDDVAVLKPKNPYPDGWASDMVPFYFDTWETDGLAITFETSSLPPMLYDYRVRKSTDELHRLNSKTWHALFDTLWAAHDRTNMNVGGHPRFVQDDTRQIGDENAQTVCLLSIGFVRDVMMWGDAGEASFLISPEDLRAKRFDRATYTWDCS